MCHTIHFHVKATIMLIIQLAFLNTSVHAQKNDSSNQVPEQNKVVSKKDSVAEIRKNSNENADSSEVKNIIVQKVYNAKRDDIPDGFIDSAGIGDIIVVEVNHLDILLEQSIKSDQKIRLFINGRKINNIEPISGAPNEDKGTLQYRLDRNTLNNETWTDILGAPPLFGAEFFIKDVKVSVGLDNEYAVKTSITENNFRLIRIHRGWFWSCFFLIILYILVVVLMAKKGDCSETGL